LQSCREVNITFQPVDTYAFTCDYGYPPEALGYLYGSGANSTTMKAPLHQAVSAVSTMVASLGEVPKYVRYDKHLVGMTIYGHITLDSTPVGTTTAGTRTSTPGMCL